MSTDLGDKLQMALSEKAKDVNTYIWKGPKVNGVQQEYKLVDATFDELQKYYNHCQQMLYNTDKKNPGRITLLGIVQDQIQKCRAELLIRWFRAEKQYTNTRCLEDLKSIIAGNKEILTPETIKTYPIGNVSGEIPIEYQNVPIDLVMSACLDSLGTYDNSHVTLSFIVKIGLWFTNQEMQKDLYEKDPETGKARNRLEVVQERLHLNKDIALRICDTGLTFSEFECLYHIRKDKYSNLTSKQLKLLSEKVLYRFQGQCEKQAQQWVDKVNEILEVAKLKGWDVTRNVE